MKYSNLQVAIPKEKRGQVNDTLLMLIDSGNMQGITAEEVYNTYTGIGGLHDLKRNDYRNFHEYTEAKKEIEQGQFFTPHTIAEQMAALIPDLKAHEMIADFTCGAGIFCNFFPEHNFYGCELDNKAHKIARFLYPDSNIALADIRYWHPPVKFDFIIGNPPFNLKWNHTNSQDYYFQKAADHLRPAGIILVIVPASFCADPFDNKREIEGITDKYNFLFQHHLPADAFKSMGVTVFPTKIMAWQRKCESMAEIQYSPVSVSWDEAATIFANAKEEARKLRIKANAEMDNTDRDFMYKAKKYLFEIKTHPAIRKDYTKAVEYLTRYREQSCPSNMSYEEWYKKHRITHNDVLAYLRRIVKKQGYKPVDIIRIVKHKYGFRVKGYSDKVKHKITENYPTRRWELNDIIYNGWNGSQLHPSIIKQYTGLLNRKRSQYQAQTLNYNEVETTVPIAEYLSAFTWITKGDVCRFNDIQRTDLGKVFTRPYGSILNWQQGSGKTSAAFAWSKYNPMKKTFVVSSALAINNTWQKFLKAQGAKFVMVERLADLQKVAAADYVLISHYYLIQLEKHIRKMVKMFSYKVNLILDESDEITNHRAKRTRAVLSCFRRVRRKLETTGTTTRNTIAELYTQLELLYNNSVNFMCTCEYKYIEDTKEGTIEKTNNNYYMQPFPAYYGNSTFKQCFNPAKTTVFGIQKHNQSIYNEEGLRRLVEYSIITRTFREIAGDKYVIVNHPCYQAPAERHVYRKIINDFHSMCYQYFQNTGNSKKETHLKLIRQISLLIKATSIPQSFTEYEGTATPNKSIAIFDEVAATPGRVAIGCITVEAMEYYVAQVQQRFPARPVFVINGDVPFKKREAIIDRFQSSNTGILICTQQSLKSSVNIPKCQMVFIESLQWNIPTILQFAFRFIRYDSPGVTTVKFFNYHDTIEANLLALLMSKEKLNDYIKTLTYRDNDDIFTEYDIDTNVLSMMISKTNDENGHMQLSWGSGGVVTAEA
jgi:predicted RNA methylase